MATQSIQRGIKNSWSLVSFAQMHGKMRVGTCTPKDGSAPYKACAFSAPGSDSRVFVSFSSNLGELSAAEIAAQKDDLQVVELDIPQAEMEERIAAGRQPSSYVLCAVGNAWGDEVELGF